MAGNSNYQRKPFGTIIRCNDFNGLDPNDLPRVGDWIRRKTLAHQLIEVIRSKSNPDTIRYKAITHPLSAIPNGARVFDAVSNLILQSY